MEEKLKTEELKKNQIQDESMEETKNENSKECTEDDKSDVKPEDRIKKEENEEKKEDNAEEEKEDQESKNYMRLMADFQNYKKRVEKEKSSIYAYANEQLMSQQLVILDNFERALEHDCQDQSYADGMELIFRQLLDVLEKAGLEEIKALGEDFDPNFHNAVMTEDNPEFESGKVTMVLQKGYKLNGKVIRSAMVKVNN